MKKALGQTVRDLKREVNKKVLKIPGIEQKILDATSNESWGPHGSLLADIAQATRNYHEYQIIMTVLWKRLSDTGKNWRHVYKALTVLEYLVGHGSERVIDEIREHAYQISTLSDFQYIDSSGRDQGNNVRRKSQSLVSLVNDKERIQELRQKAFANKDKYRPSSATGGMYRPGSGGGGYGDRYDDDRYEGRYRDEDQDVYGRDRDGGYRDDDRYGRGGDPYSRDGDQYGRDPEDRYSRESYRDDDYKGNQFGSRTRSFDGDKERSYEDDDRYASRNGGGRAEDHPQDEGRFERKLSEHDINAPPSYEETIGNARNHSQDESDGGTVVASAPKASSPPAPRASSPPGSAGQYQNTAAAAAVASVSASPTNKEVNGFDEFDPRGSAAPAPQAPANTSDMDLFGSFSDINTLALVPVTSENETSGAHISANSGFDNNFVSLSAASTTLNQPDEDPWGGNPFKATPQDNFTAQPQSFAPAPFPPAGTSGSSGTHPQIAPQADPVSQFGFGDSLNGLTYTPPTVTDTILPQATSQPFPPPMPAAQPNSDILANILPPSVPSGFVAQQPPPAVAQIISQQSHPAAPMSSQQTHSQAALPDLLQQSGPSAPLSSLASLSAPNGLPAKTQTSNDKFETKSTVWADTLNRGLVNLNISGPKINPLADIGIDFDAINRKEKRQERASAATSTVTSTVTMGRAMGSGSGIGRAGASVLAAAPPNPMMGGGMGMGSMGVGGGLGMGSMGMGGGVGMAMGGYGGGMNQQPVGMGMGMGMNMGVGMGMMGQGAPMRPPVGMPPTGPGMPGAYNHPMMGMGGYSSQQPYGGYR